MNFEYETDLLTPELKNKMNVNVIDETVQSKGFISFDVSEQNLLAVAHANSYISIYDENGIFLNAITIQTYGGVYYVSWLDDILWVYIQRNRLAVGIQNINTSNPSITEVYKIKNTSENNSIWQEYHSKNKIEVNHIGYEMVNLIPYQEKYDTIMKYDSNGTVEEYISVKENMKENILENALSLFIWIFIFSVILFISKMKFYQK